MMQVRKLYTFVLKGMFAHFRKIETNSSSLSYFFPPPTTIQGILAALLGLERDSYYDFLNEEKLLLSWSPLCSTRKITVTTNYIFAKEARHLNMSSPNPHTQIPLELLISENFPKEPLSFRIFLGVIEPKLASQIESQLAKKRFFYPPFLGSAFCPGWIEHWEGPLLFTWNQPKDKVEIQTVLPLHTLSSSYSLPLTESRTFFRDLVVRSFTKNRMRKSIMEILWEKEGKTFEVHLKSPYFECYLKTGELWRGVLF